MKYFIKLNGYFSHSDPISLVQEPVSFVLYIAIGIVVALCVAIPIYLISRNRGKDSQQEDHTVENGGNEKFQEIGTLHLYEIQNLNKSFS